MNCKPAVLKDECVLALHAPTAIIALGDNLGSVASDNLLRSLQVHQDLLLRHAVVNAASDGVLTHVGAPHKERA